MYRKLLRSYDKFELNSLFPHHTPLLVHVRNVEIKLLAVIVSISVFLSCLGEAVERQTRNIVTSVYHKQFPEQT